MSTAITLNMTVKELVLASRRPAEVALALAELGITPRYADWQLCRAAEAVGMGADAVEHRLTAVGVAGV